MTTDDGQDVAFKLSSAVPATIATLSPELPANSSTRGIVTITWPYSHVRASFAFILAEPDFRIRLNRGQVRVNFKGLAAAAVGNCGLESQDEVVLALDGATWQPANTSRRQSVSGADIDYQLTFSDEVALQVKFAATGEVKLVTTKDAPPARQEADRIPDPPAISAVEPTPFAFLEAPVSAASPPPYKTPARPARVNILGEDEFNSPAFIKRARASYGSLFEDGYDIFEDDGGAKNRGRKRARFGRDSIAWRYTSQSPSPEPEEDVALAGEVATPQTSYIEETAQEHENVQSRASLRSPQPRLPQIGEGGQTSLQIPPTDTLPALLSPGTMFSAEGLPSRYGVPSGSSDKMDFDQGQPSLTHEPILREHGTGPSSAHITDRVHGVFPQESDEVSIPGWTAMSNVFNPRPEPHLDINDSHSNMDHIHLPQDFNIPGLETSQMTGDVLQQDPHFLGMTPSFEPRESDSPPMSSYPPLGPDNGGYRGFQDASEIPRAQFTYGGSDSGAPFSHPVDHFVQESRSHTSEQAFRSQPGSSDGPTSDRPVVLDDESEEDEEEPEEDYLHNGPRMIGHSPTLKPIKDEDDPLNYGVDAEYSDDEEELSRDPNDRAVDYDTRLKAADDDDDTHDEDLQMHELEPRFEAQSSDEDSEVEAEYDEHMRDAAHIDDEQEDEDAFASQIEDEGGYEEEEEEDDDEEIGQDQYSDDDELDEDDSTSPSPPPQPSRFSLPKPSVQPVVIDLLSSSEDEAEVEDEPTEIKEQKPGAMVEEYEDAETSEDYDEQEDEGLSEEEEDVEDDDDNNDVGDFQDHQVEAVGIDEEDESSILNVEETKVVTVELVSSNITADEDEMDQEDESLPTIVSGAVETMAHSTLHNERLSYREVVEQQDTSDDDEMMLGTDANVDLIDQLPGPDPRQRNQEVGSSPAAARSDEIAEPTVNTQPESSQHMETLGINAEDEKSAEASTSSSPPPPPEVSEARQSSRSPSSPHHDQEQDIDEPSRTGDADKRVADASLGSDEVVKPEPVIQQLPTPRNTQLVQSEVVEVVERIAVDDAPQSSLPSRGVASLDLQVVSTTALTTTAFLDEEAAQVDSSSNVRALPIPPSSPREPPGEIMFDTQAIDTATSPVAFNTGRSPIIMPEVKSSLPQSEASQPPLSPSRVTMETDDDLQASLLEEYSHELDQTDVQSFEQQGDVPHDTVKMSTPPRLPQLMDVSPNFDVGARLVRAVNANSNHMTPPKASPRTQWVPTRPIQAQKEPSPQPRTPKAQSVATPQHEKTPRIPLHSSPDVEDRSILLARSSAPKPGVSAASSVKDGSVKLEDDSESMATIKLHLARHLRDELRDCYILEGLRYHLGKVVDVAAVVMMEPAEPQRTKAREFAMSFTITDQSIGPNSVMEVQFYRPHKEALPVVKPGDVILLRRFKVISLTNKGFGLRTQPDGSSWAVFDREGEPASIKGPPVEYGAKESLYVDFLREWHGLLDEKAQGRLERANKRIIDASGKKRK
ncbi:DNA binding [Microdochium nivale]|nr:DNA binding [Microdochium nivale]